MEGRMVHQLAIDRPSHKFVSFLKKHYGLKNAVPQVGQKSLIKGHFKRMQDFYRINSDLRIGALVSKYKFPYSVHIPESIRLLAANRAVVGYYSLRSSYSAC